MEIKVSQQVMDLTQIQNRGTAQRVPDGAYPTPSRAISIPVAQEAQAVTTHSYTSYTPMLAEVVTARPSSGVADLGDIELPPTVLSHFDVNGDGEWSSEERLASQVMLKVKDDFFSGDIAAMSDYLASEGYSSPMSLDEASAVFELLSESTS